MLSKHSARAENLSMRCGTRCASEKACVRMLWVVNLPEAVPALVHVVTPAYQQPELLSLEHYEFSVVLFEALSPQRFALLGLTRQAPQELNALLEDQVFTTGAGEENVFLLPPHPVIHQFGVSDGYCDEVEVITLKVSKTGILQERRRPILHTLGAGSRYIAVT